MTLSPTSTPVPAPTPVLELRGVTKRYDHGNVVVDDLNLSVNPGELLALLGPSGCGKTTTLRLIAGFEGGDGEIVIAGQRVMGPGAFAPPERRGVGMVFQDYALFPHLNVLDNVTFGLRMPRAQARERARETLSLVGLTVFERRMPHQLSGGQQQRVALARALAPRPRLLLLDEPFSNLDAALRLGTRSEVRRILRDLGATAILVTHDQEEALAFADRLVLMRAGRVEQQGAPEELYRAPSTAFVANFLGRSNLIAATARGGRALTPLGELVLDDPGDGSPSGGNPSGGNPSGGSPGDGAVLLSLRPEDLCLGESGAQAEVLDREFRGHDVTYTIRVGGHEFLAHCHGWHTLRPGDRTRVRFEGRARVVSR